jgi:hypothetical protein
VQPILSQDAIEQGQTFFSFQMPLAAGFEHHADVFCIASPHTNPTP